MMDKEFRCEYCAEEITEALAKAAGREDLDGRERGEVEDAVSWLEAAAENPYNHDYFRTLYRLMEQIVEHAERTA